MYDELFPVERATSLSQSVQRPYIPPAGAGAFTGFGSAMAYIVPNAVLTTGNAWSGILDAYGKAAAYRDAATDPMILAGRPAPDPDKLKAETIDRIGDNQLGPALRAEAKKYTPDPLATGTAGQIVFGVGTSLAKAGAYSLTGPAAPVLFGLDVGVNRADELKDQGVDATTANLAGVVSGVTGAVGLKLPAAMGATRLQSAAIGAVTNPVLNVAEVGGIRLMLQHADYDKIAQQYQPFDPLNLTVAAIVGAGFGAGFHSGRAKAPTGETPPAAPILTPDEHAAALTLHEAQTRDGDTLTQPGDIAAANAAKDAQDLARQQLDTGELVSVAADVPVDPQRMEAAARATFERATEDLRAELTAEAGNWAQPGEIPTARAQLAQLQHDIEYIQSEQIFKAEAKAQQQRGLSRKQAEAAARESITQRVADMQAQSERLANFIESNRRATMAEQDLVTLNRGEIPARYAHLFGDEARQPQAGAPVRGEEPSLPADATPAGQQARADAPEPAPPTPDVPAVADAPIVAQVVDAVSRLLGRDTAAPAQPRADALKADTPEQGHAFDFATRNPDALIPTGDVDAAGNPVHVRAADFVQQAADIEKQAQKDTAAFAAAVNCALRFPRA
ncbi:hypothetical protein G3T20_05830 [Bordetella hinzii]|uniref:hypothetical protein n=1 Tax=Bordetella hinzii TaxID=103855 RepID=UPI0013EFE48D|nr:hypothetical protein [Bordetella hinzii]QII84263.1 hypothetical protein G3T20_05830 [Bordetella hinzii]